MTAGNGDWSEPAAMPSRRKDISSSNRVVRACFSRTPANFDFALCAKVRPGRVHDQLVARCAGMTARHFGIQDPQTPDSPDRQTLTGVHNPPGRCVFPNTHRPACRRHHRRRLDELHHPVRRNRKPHQPLAQRRAREVTRHPPAQRDQGNQKIAEVCLLGEASAKGGDRCVGVDQRCAPGVAGNPRHRDTSFSCGCICGYALRAQRFTILRRRLRSVAVRSRSAVSAVSPNCGIPSLQR